MTSKEKKMSLTVQIMIGMGAGALLGILLTVFADVPGEEALDEKAFNDLGAGSVVQATAGLGDIVRPSEEQA